MSETATSGIPNDQVGLMYAIKACSKLGYIFDKEDFIHMAYLLQRTESFFLEHVFVHAPHGATCPAVEKQISEPSTLKFLRSLNLAWADHTPSHFGRTKDYELRIAIQNMEPVFHDSMAMFAELVRGWESPVGIKILCAVDLLISNNASKRIFEGDITFDEKDGKILVKKDQIHMARKQLQVRLYDALENREFAKIAPQHQDATVSFDLDSVMDELNPWVFIPEECRGTGLTITFNFCIDRLTPRGLPIMHRSPVCFVTPVEGEIEYKEALKYVRDTLIARGRETYLDIAD